MTSTTQQPIRGEIYAADMGKALAGSGWENLSPVLVIQNNIGNRYSPTVIVAAVASKLDEQMAPHVILPSHILGWKAVVLLCQILTIDKSRLRWRIGFLDAATMGEVNRAIPASLGIVSENAGECNLRIPGSAT